MRRIKSQKKREYMLKFSEKKVHILTKAMTFGMKENGNAKPLERE